MAEHQKPALWEAMKRAAEESPLISNDTGGGIGYLKRREAARLRAIADRVVPEHLCEADDSWDASAIAYRCVRDRLLAAADEAEATGDG